MDFGLELELELLLELDPPPASEEEKIEFEDEEEFEEDGWRGESLRLQALRRAAPDSGLFTFTLNFEL